MNPQAQRLLERIEAGSAQVAVVGLGYVGLPLALSFAEAGLRVLGLDVDRKKVDQLNAGESYIAHLDGGRCREAVASGRLEATADPARLAQPDAVVICVPTPLTPQREPEMRHVVDTARMLAAVLRPGQLVVLESTTYPGTTEGLLRQELEASGLECGRDFFLAYSPEREDPGNPDFGTRSIPKVVGGIGAEATELAVALYRPVVVEVVEVANPRVAEASKLTENIFRAVNIALVNELKIVYEKMGIDVWDVLDAASTKPFGFMRFNPGPGWGGHCIPIDPFYLTWKAREHGLTPRFIELAGEINVLMPGYVIDRLRARLATDGLKLSGSKVLLLGLAYKRDVADPRESPAFEILSRLLEEGAQVAYHDPHIPEAPTMRSWRDLPPLRSQALTAELLESQDAVVVVTDHRSVDYPLVLQHAPRIIDTRGVFRDPSPKVVPA